MGVHCVGIACLPTYVPALCSPAPCAQPRAPFPSPLQQQPWQLPPAWPSQSAWPSAPTCPSWQRLLSRPAHHAQLQSGPAAQPPSPACQRQQVLLAACSRLPAAVHPVQPPDQRATHQPLAQQRAWTRPAGGCSVVPAALLSGDARRSAPAVGLLAADAALQSPGGSQILAAGRRKGPLLAGRGRGCRQRCLVGLSRGSSRRKWPLQLQLVQRLVHAMSGAICAALLEHDWHFNATWSEAVLTGLQAEPQCYLLAHLARQNQWPLHRLDHALRPSSPFPVALSCHSCDKPPALQRPAGPTVAASVEPASCSTASSTWRPQGLVHLPWPALSQCVFWFRDGQTLPHPQEACLFSAERICEYSCYHDVCFVHSYFPAHSLTVHAAHDLMVNRLTWQLLRPARPGEAVSCRHPGQYRRWSAVADCSMASTLAAAGLLLTTLQARQMQVRQWLQAADNLISQADPRLLQIRFRLISFSNWRP